jgi:hypothetical protein
VNNEFKTAGKAPQGSLFSYSVLNIVCYKVPMNLKKKLKAKIIGRGKTEAMVHSPCFGKVNISSSLRVRVVQFLTYQVPEKSSSTARYYDNSCLFSLKLSIVSKVMRK